MNLAPEYRTDCVFCKIIRREIPAEIVHDEGYVVAFRDRQPQAPEHVVIVPRYHHDNLTAMYGLGQYQGHSYDLASPLLRAAAKIATKLGIDKTGYRVVINTGEHAGQTVQHLHLHLLGGERLALLG